MVLSSRFLVLPAALLALCAPAYAGNDQAPGQIKKQDQLAPQATAPVTPAPSTGPAPQSQVKGNVPVNKGTLKKAVQKKATTAPTSVAPSVTRKPRARRQPAARPTTRSRTTTRSGTTNRVRHGQSTVATTPARPRTRNHVPATSAPTTAVPVVVRARPQRTTVEDQRVAGARQDANDSAPLTSISRAADSVVEVIPGAVILALAGLSAMVLLLIARSWAMERRRGKALAESYGVTVEALATAIEAKDHCTGGHIERVRRLGLLLAREIVPREARDPQMEYGFLLHDIGKLAVPDEILRAPGRLSGDQWALMRRHPEEGVRMLASVPFLDKALDVVRYHHERWDGGGYPAGLRGEEIPLWARIFSVVDALDAITAARPYRPGRSYQEALEEIRRHSGSQFDPAVVAALERIDPAEIEPLLEPSQIVESPLAPVADLQPLIPA